jgi:hypothetical protein
MRRVVIAWIVFSLCGLGSSAIAGDSRSNQGWQAAGACTGAVSGIMSANPRGVFFGVNSIPSCLKSSHDLGVSYGSRNLPPNIPSGFRTLGQQGIPVYGGTRRR